jgi:hypothetical protein
VLVLVHGGSLEYRSVQLASDSDRARLSVIFNTLFILDGLNLVSVDSSRAIPDAIASGPVVVSTSSYLG